MKKDLFYVVSIFVLGTLLTICLCGWASANKQCRKLQMHINAADSLINDCANQYDNFYDTVGSGDAYSDWVRTRQHSLRSFMSLHMDERQLRNTNINPLKHMHMYFRFKDVLTYVRISYVDFNTAEVRIYQKNKVSKGFSFFMGGNICSVNVYKNKQGSTIVFLIDTTNMTHIDFLEEVGKIFHYV